MLRGVSGSALTCAKPWPRQDHAFVSTPVQLANVLDFYVTRVAVILTTVLSDQHVSCSARSNQPAWCFQPLLSRWRCLPASSSGRERRLCSGAPPPSQRRPLPAAAHLVCKT